MTKSDAMTTPIPDPDDHVKSPCIRVCELDAGRSHCVGCLRTLAEITAWGGMSPADRRAVIADLPRRAKRKTTPFGLRFG